MGCQRCGFENPDGFAFCGKCGAPLAPAPPGLSASELDHLRLYLPADQVDALHLEHQSPGHTLLDGCVDHLARLVETSSAYFPAYLLSGLGERPAAAGVGGEFIQGSLLFADISGFTAMSDQLSHAGRAGAEEITEVVNRYFEVMLSILDAHGGQLIKFGGDSLLGLFHEPGSARNAVGAAEQMQAAMGSLARISTSQGEFNLRMKAGVHRGRFFSARLGDTHSMEYALFGREVGRVVQVANAASGGQVAVSRTAKNELADGVTYLPVENVEDAWLVAGIPPGAAHDEPARPRGKLPRLDTSLAGLRQAVQLLDVLTPYLPAGLLKQFNAGINLRELPGEHRPVAALFANIQGLDEAVDRLGPGRVDTILSLLNTYYLEMSHAALHYGVTVNKIDPHEQGSKLLVFFGAPVAHEDDPERAVRAALEMQETLAGLAHSLPGRVGLPGLHLEQRIGISYGNVFAGHVGASWRHEYTVMGTEVNLAARLMAAAGPGEVSASLNVRRKIQALFDFRPRGSLNLKGFPKPVPIFQVQPEQPGAETLRGLKEMYSPLVGRETDLGHLHAALKDLSQGRGRIVSVTGDSGLGKSRLVTDALESSAEAGSFNWVVGRCLSYAETVSYWPVKEAIWQILGGAAGSERRDAAPRLRHLLDEHLTERDLDLVMPFLLTFLDQPLDPRQSEWLRGLDPENLQRQTFLAVRLLVETAARHKPLVVVLEDIHWIDQASQELLEFLMASVERAPLVLVLVYRPERTRRCWKIQEKAERTFGGHYDGIILSPLDRKDSEQLLRNLAGLGDWPAVVRETILNRSEGNPLYLEEVLRSLVELGVLRQDTTGEWTLQGSLEAFEVPETLQGVMLSRLDRLSEAGRWVARSASVVGRVFSFDVVAHVLSREGDPPEHSSLVELQQHEIIQEAQRLAEMLYVFRHLLMQEVCYGSLPVRTRRRHHYLIAGYLHENRAGWQEVENVVPLIAYHAFAGEHWELALEYQLQAGQQAKQLYANQEALEHFIKAQQSAGHLPAGQVQGQRLVIYQALGELYIVLGQYDEAEKYLRRAYDLAYHANSQDDRIHACRWLARLNELRGDYQQAFVWIGQGLAMLEGRQNEDAAQMHITAGLIYSRQGNEPLALEHSQFALKITETLGLTVSRARANNMLGVIARNRGEIGRAAGYFDSALQLYEMAGDLHGQGITHNLIANASFNAGNWQQAARAYRQARDIFDHMSDIYNRAIADNNLGGIALNQGDYEDALRFFGSALHSMQQIGASLYVLGIIEMNLGAVYTRLGQTSDARLHLQTSLDDYTRAGGRDFLPELHRQMAQAALVDGNLDEASRQASTALQIARELSMRGEEGCSLRLMGETAERRGQPAAAEPLLLESVTILESVADEYELARSRLALARVELALGRRQAAAHLEQAVSVFRKLQAAPDLQAALTLAARANPQEAPPDSGL